MKLYIIDNTRKLKKIERELEEQFNVEAKENCKFKMTKNDYAILSDEFGLPEGLDKLKNIIFLVCRKENKYIWKLANDYKTIDIIDNEENEKYIFKRIERRVGREL